jgi:hypothetical protein
MSVSPTAASKAATGEVAAQVQETIAALEAALQTPAKHLKDEVDRALRAAVRLRDTLITRLRGESAAEDVVATRAALDQVNVAVSLIAGVEYPAEKVQREALQQAKGVLEGLVGAGWV